MNPNSLANLKSYVPGQSGNPGGKPVAIRDALNKKFLKQLSAEFDEVGREAISRVAREDPSTFIRVLAALQPKEMEVKRQFDDITDEQLEAAVLTVRAILAAQNAGDGTDLQTLPQQTKVLLPVSETT